MDMSRISHVQPQPIRPAQVPQGASAPESQKKRGRKIAEAGWVKITELLLLFSGTVLVVALLFGIYEGGPSEYKYVDKTKYQAVFLNGGVTNGQVLFSTYFGKITSLNNQFIVLQDVYYITTNSTAASSTSNVQLTKLGCQQIHAPTNEMVINKSQVAFWKNLQSSGQVAKAITTFQKDNPNGPNCSTSSSTSSTPTSTNSSATPSNTTTTPKTTNTTP